MTHHPVLFLPLLAATALALSACEGGNGTEDIAPTPAASEASGEDANGEKLVVAETGWLTIGSDGAIQATFFDADGRYRDMRNGELIGQGGWEQRADGRVCFAPDSGTNACWQTSQPDANGTVIASAENGTRIELKRITYNAPISNEESAQTDDE